MNVSDFNFYLPQELIAQQPSGIRGQDRLMLLEKKSGKISHFTMENLPDLISPDALMIFNDSRVRRARVYGVKESTGRETEFMFLNPENAERSLWNAMVKNAKKQKTGMRYKFQDGTLGVIAENDKNANTEFRTLRFDFPLSEDWFERNGRVPLPPYIKRKDTKQDDERYQNVYANAIGSAACPTAGLHFTTEMLAKLDSLGIERAFVTLHVGLGTFLPVREQKVENHKMHEEWYSVSAETAEKINKAKAKGRPVLAVGTTSARTLESAAQKIILNGEIPGKNNKWIESGTSFTNIFMYPGYDFKIVDQLFTNFHTPQSTLIMLASALAGRENILNAYAAAVQEKYRFFSYGDCMLIK